MPCLFPLQAAPASAAASPKEDLDASKRANDQNVVEGPTNGAAAAAPAAAPAPLAGGAALLAKLR